jgi:hypothetical protein
MRLSASWTGTPPAGFVGVRRRRFVLCVLLFLGAVAGVAEAQPTQLTVRVLQPNGNPVSLATVCLAQGSQAASRLTTGGVAVLTGLPAGAYTLHVIKSNFQTKSQSVNLSGTQEVTVTLQPGVSTPPAGVNCQGGGAVTTLPPITITSFEVEGLPADFKVTSPPATTLRLRATFDRRPAFFRIIEDSGYAYTTPLQNLQTRPWAPLPPNAPVAPFIYLFPLDLARPYGTRIVHLQVAHVASEDAASQIKSISVILTPGQFRTSILTGAELLQFISRARDAGYSFVLPRTRRRLFDIGLFGGGKEVSFTQSCPPAMEFALGADPGGDHLYKQENEYRVFLGPALNPFWKILNVSIESPTTRFTRAPIRVGQASGFTMQGIQQLPARTFPIESEIKVKTHGCIEFGFFEIDLSKPAFTSITIEGPSNLNVREAFPPRGPTAGGPVAPPPLFPIPPGTLRPRP